MTLAALRQRPWLIWTIASLLLIIAYGYRLNFPPKEYYDETYHVQSAREFVTLNGYSDKVHPPLGKLLIALGILLFGDTSWAWRFFPLVAGLAIPFVVYFLTKQITPPPPACTASNALLDAHPGGGGVTSNKRVAGLACALFCLDCISFTQARIAMLNTPMMLFGLLSIFFFNQYAFKKTWTRKKAFLFSGIFLGLSMATRVVALWTAGFLGIFLLKLFWQEKDKKAFLQETVFSFCILPLILYFSSYLIVPFLDGYGWSDIWKANTYMTHYHMTLKRGHTYGSQWWSWPFMIRPIWYHFEREAGSVYGILCIGNPAIFWLIPVAIGYVAHLFWKERSPITAFILLGFGAQWLPWSLVARVKFFHYFDTAMPFAVMALALALERVWQSGRIGRQLVIGYLAVVVVLFIYWYPLLIGYPISEAFFQHHLWFKSWI